MTKLEGLILALRFEDCPESVIEAAKRFGNWPDAASEELETIEEQNAWVAQCVTWYDEAVARTLSKN